MEDAYDDADDLNVTSFDGSSSSHSASFSFASTETDHEVYDYEILPIPAMKTDQEKYDYAAFSITETKTDKDEYDYENYSTKPDQEEYDYAAFLIAATKTDQGEDVYDDFVLGEDGDDDLDVPPPPIPKRKQIKPKGDKRVMNGPEVPDTPRPNTPCDFNKGWRHTIPRPLPLGRRGVNFQYCMS